MLRSAFLQSLSAAAIAQAVPAEPAIAMPARILVLGDSVTWGQGLRDDQKMHRLLAQRVFGATGVAPYVAHYAHSGAIIGAGAPFGAMAPWWPPEIPSPHATIFEQLDLVSATEIDPRFDLIVVDGGLNDVDIHYVFNPQTKPDQVAAKATAKCGADMIGLLQAIDKRVMQWSPHVRCFVLTYYPILSDASRFPNIWNVATVLAQETISPPPPPTSHVAMRAQLSQSPVQSLKEQLVANSRALRSASLAAHTNAVATVNAGAAAPRFTLIDPNILESECAFTTTPLIWGLTTTEKPEDPLTDDRVRYCDYELRPEMKNPLDAFVCRRASVGHPNVAGAQRYAETMFAALHSTA